MGDTGHDIPLYEGEDRADDVQSQQDQQQPSHGAEIDPRSGARHLIHQTVEDQGDGVAQLPGAHDGESGAADGENHHKEQTDFVFTQISGQLFEGAFEILGLLAGHVGTMARAVAHHPSAAGLAFVAHCANSSFDSCERAIC